MKKYDLVNKQPNGLWQIRALRDFGDVKAGDLGGYVQYEDNLSQTGNCWVYGNARVYDNAMVYNNAIICGNAVICNNAKVYGNALVYGNVIVYGNAGVYDNARICEKNDIFWISNIGSRYSTLTIFKTADGFKLSTGCFIGTFKEFKKQVSKKDIKDQHRKEYEALYPLIGLRFGKR